MLVNQIFLEQELKRAKRQAHICLVIATSIFIITSIITQGGWFPDQQFLLGLIKMASEAAVVGGLADWFAVSALFRPIPAFRPIPHTNIVARKKAAIAQNLAEFVKEKFFNAPAIERLIQESEPAQGVGRWLSQPDNAQRVSLYIGDILKGVLKVVDDTPVQNLIIRGFKRAINRLELAPLASGLLNVLTRERRHQEVLDQLIAKLAALCEHPQTQAYLAEKLSEWVRSEYGRLEKILPSSWLGEKGARIAVQAIAKIIQEINEQPDHPVRVSFDEYIQDYIQRVKDDPDMAQKLNELRFKLIENESLMTYLTQVWQDVRKWLNQDLEDSQGRLYSHLSAALVELAQSIGGDENLARAINNHLAEAGRYMAPELADFLTTHIRRTIESWDENDMAFQVELNIGKDLQKVRINGTLVGGLIGAILFLAEQGIGLIHQGWS